MKMNRKVLAVIISTALVFTLTFPLRAFASTSGSVSLIDQFPGGKYNQSFDYYVNSQGNIEQLMVGIKAVPKDDAGHGHTWTIVADENAVPGTVLTIAVQTKGNNYVAYVIQVDGPGEFQFPHDVSLGRGFAFAVDYIEPEPEDPIDPEDPIVPDPDPEVGSLVITKAFAGDVTEAPENWDATFEVRDSEDEIIATVKYSDFNNGTSHIISDLPFGAYNVAETGGEIEGYTLTVSYTGAGSVAEDADGALIVTNSYEEDEDDTPPPTTPTTDPDPEVGNLVITKVFDGDVTEAPENWEATFEVRDSEDEIIATVKYSDFNDGTSHIISDLPFGAYNVAETGGEIEGYTLTVSYTGAGSVTEDADGALMVTNSYVEDEDDTPPPPTTSNPPDQPTPGSSRQQQQQDPVIEDILSFEEVVIFEEEEVPLGDFRNREGDEVEVEEIEILDEEVPMSEMPQTGIEDAVILWIIALCAALATAGAMSVAASRAKKDND